MTDNSTVRDLVGAISEGRACLLLGQDHTEGLVGSVTPEVILVICVAAFSRCAAAIA